MPIVPFDSLPDDARVWIFGSDRALTGTAAEQLLGEVDDFLAGWRAHGQPLTVARAWTDDRFLAVGVDQSDAHASGCSIDGLFRRLQALQAALGAQLVGGGRVHFRAADGAPRSVPRAELRARIAAGEIGADTPVFDTTLTTMAEWRTRFERPARETWVSAQL
jgi:hypothetical protein